MTDIYSSLPIFSLSDYLLKSEISFWKFVIFGNFGAYNIGDEAILAGQIEDLKKIRRSQITVISRYPKQIKKLHHVASVGLISLGAVIKSITRADVVILGGGGLFCKNDRGIKGVVFQLYTLGMFLLLPHLFRKKIVVWGIGIYPDMERSIALVCKLLLQHVSLITVRDQASYTLLRRWKIPAVFCKDNSFLMSTLDTETMAHDPFFTHLSLSSYKNVGIAVKKPSSPTEQKTLITAMTEIIRREYKTTRFWFYSLDTHPLYASDADLTHEIVASLGSDIRSVLQYLIIPSNRHPQWVFSTFGLLDGIIALRLHASIFAYRFHLPLLGLTYSEKCRSFLSSTGRRPYTINTLSHGLYRKTMKLAADSLTRNRVPVREKEEIYAYQ
jgi:polysaccharide pyruvyl transferase CsaB